MISQEHLPVLAVAVIMSLAIWWVYRDLQRIKERLDEPATPTPAAPPCAAHGPPAAPPAAAPPAAPDAKAQPAQQAQPKGRKGA